IELARQYGNGPRSLKSIGKEKALSAHYLEQLAAPIRNARLIRSDRGAYGGYTLSEDPSDICAGDIIRVLELTITPVDGIEEEFASQQALWMRIWDVVRDVLETTTLRDLIEYDSHEVQEEFMFYI